MSTRVESPPVGGGFFGATLVLAVVVALIVGAFVGSLVTHAIDSDGGTLSPTFVARGTPALTVVDVGNGSKAIEGPMLAERFTGLGSANVWDAYKFDVMEGRQFAEPLRSEAMEARQLAEEARRHRPVGGPLG